MAFYSPDKLKPRRIEIDPNTPNSGSPEMLQRMERIEQNYAQLDAVLLDLESRIAADERLSAMDDLDIDFETEFGVKRKRKWRSATAKRKSTKRSGARSSRPSKKHSAQRTAKQVTNQEALSPEVIHGENDSADVGSKASSSDPRKPR